MHDDLGIMQSEGQISQNPQPRTRDKCLRKTEYLKTFYLFVCFYSFARASEKPSLSSSAVKKTQWDLVGHFEQRRLACTRYSLFEDSSVEAGASLQCFKMSGPIPDATQQGFGLLEEPLRHFCARVRWRLGHSAILWEGGKYPFPATVTITLSTNVNYWLIFNPLRELSSVRAAHWTPNLRRGCHLEERVDRNTCSQEWTP